MHSSSKRSLESDDTYKLDSLLNMVNSKLLRGTRKKETREHWKTSAIQLMIAGKNFIDTFEDKDPFFSQYSHQDFLLYFNNTDSNSSNSEFTPEELKNISTKLELTYFDSLIFVTLIHCNKLHSQLYLQLAKSLNNKRPIVANGFSKNKNAWIEKVKKFFQSVDFKEYLDPKCKENSLIIYTIQNLFYAFATPELMFDREEYFENIKNTIKTMDILKNQLDMWKKTLNSYLIKNEKIFFVEYDDEDREEWINASNLLHNVWDDHYNEKLKNFIHEFDTDINDFK